MNIINLTPHVITLLISEKMVEIASSGLARCESTEEKIGEIGGIAIYHNSYGKIIGLPEPKKDTIYIVSRLVAEAAKDRDDIYVVTKTVRDSNGQISGALGLAKI